MRLNVRVQTFAPWTERRLDLGIVDSFDQGKALIQDWLHNNVEDITRFEYGGDRDSMNHSTYLFTETSTLVFIGSTSVL
jgi:hypothetical protein